MASVRLDEMTSLDVVRIVENELASTPAFPNWHGITADNVRSFLVPPFPIECDPDDLETKTRSMWVVLQERADPTAGYVVVLDPSHHEWGVAEHVRDDSYILIASAQSLAGALEAM